jgi:hypothetical protein
MALTIAYEVKRGTKLDSLKKKRKIVLTYIKNGKKYNNEEYHYTDLKLWT